MSGAIVLGLGFAAGFVARPMFVSAPVPASPTGAVAAQPSEGEAQAAVRRFGREASIRLPLAVLQLGACERSRVAAGLECAVTLVPRPGAQPQSRLLGFAQINGRWERTY